MPRKRYTEMTQEEIDTHRAKGRQYYYANKPAVSKRAAARRVIFRQDVTWQMLSLYRKAQQRSKRYNVPCTITKEWVLSQPRMCNVSGMPFQIPLVGRGPYSPSIDRIDSSKGYTPENTQFVTCFYNMAKNEWGEQEIQDLIISYAEAIKRLRSMS